MSTNALNPTPFNTPAFTPRSATLALPNATGYVVGEQIGQDTFQAQSQSAGATREVKQDRYLQARAHQQQLPMWQRILTGAAILTGAILGGSFLIQKINTLPIIQDALNSHNAWVRRPAKIMSFFGEMAVFETLMEFGTIGLEALMAFFL
jgi:hypothetical protein